MASDHLPMSHKWELGINTGWWLCVGFYWPSSQAFMKVNHLQMITNSFKNFNIVSMFPTDQTSIKVHVIKLPTILDNPPGIIEVNSMYSRI